MKKFFIYILAVLLGLLFYWLLGFLLDDMSQWPGLRIEVYTAPIKHSALQLSQDKISKQIDSLQNQISDTRSQQNILKDNMQNTRTIINQVLGMQKLQTQKTQSDTSALVQTFKKNTDLFLEQQSQLQQLNQSIAQLNTRLLPLQNQYSATSRKLNGLYFHAQEKYRFKMGLIQIGILLVLLLITGIIVRKRSKSPYRLIWWAINISVLSKIFFVIHDYFPSRYFKYVLILALIIVVWLALYKLIKHSLSPDRKQYRLAYKKYLCGICEFPIRRKDEECYICPDCGTRLFEKCSACQHTRHSLLSYCEYCGASGLVNNPITSS